MAKREVDFIRYLLDYIDNKIDQKIQNKNTQYEVDVVSTDDCCDSVESPIDDDKRFIPPLQANIEMMKKMAGVPPKDETLSRSQHQGGPAGEKSPDSKSDFIKVLGVLDNGMFSQ